MQKFLAGVVLLGWLLTGCYHDSWIRERPPVILPGTQSNKVVLPIDGGRPSPDRSTDQPPVEPLVDWCHPRDGRISSRWTWIVIHHSATESGGAACFDRAHQRNGWDELGYHFVIGNGTDTPDGQIEVGTRWHKQKHGAHCKTPGNYYNNHGIGICLVGNFEKTAPTLLQLEALDELLRFLCNACGIPPERVTTHSEVTHKTLCPGRKFGIESVRRRLKGN